MGALLISGSAKSVDDGRGAKMGILKTKSSDLRCAGGTPAATKMNAQAGGESTSIPVAWLAELVSGLPVPNDRNLGVRPLKVAKRRYSGDRGPENRNDESLDGRGPSFESPMGAPIKTSNNRKFTF